MVSPAVCGDGIVLNQIPRPTVKSAAREAGVGFKARVFTRFSHLATMLFARPTHANRTRKAESVDKMLRRTPGPLPPGEIKNPEQVLHGAMGCCRAHL